MKMYIFRKEGFNDFVRIPIEVVKIREKSVLINHEGKIIEMKWEDEYSFSQLSYDDILNVYIFTNDLEKCYVLPQLMELSERALDLNLLIKSELDKLRSSYKKDMKIRTVFIKQLIEFFGHRMVDDITCFGKNSIIHPNLQDNINELKELLDKYFSDSNLTPQKA